MDAATRPALATGRVAEAGVASAVAALLAWAVFAGGGSGNDGLARVGIPAIVCAAVALALALRGLLPLPRPDRAGLVALLAATALTTWVGLSISWSIAGDRSWEWLDRWVAYLAFLALGLVAASSARGVGRVAGALVLVTGAAIGWALLGVAIPALFEDGDRIARLREPVGYWNGLAVLANAALALGLWAAGRVRIVFRASGAVLVYGSTVALLLTQSRAGIVGAVAVVGLWLALSDERLVDSLRTALFTAPGLVVAGWAFTRPALVEDGAARADRVTDGRWFAVLALAGALLVAVLAVRAPVTRLVTAHRRRVRTTLLQAAGSMFVVAAIGLVAAVGNPFSWASSQVTGGECTNAPGRLTDLCANNRLAWWDEAIEIAFDRPIGGSGAGTFELARRRYRDDATVVSQPHSVPLQLLADTGIVGLALGLVFAVAAALSVRRALRLPQGLDRSAAVALACVVVAYGVHALVDYDLDFIAVTAPALVALGALISAGASRAGVLFRAPGLVALAATTAAAVLSVALPALAERDVDRALDAADAGRVGEAVDAADRARLLDPLSTAPLEALAVAADAGDDERTSVAWYEKATDLQPENPDTWYELGLYHFLATGDLCDAYQALNHSHTLDPMSRRWFPGGPLDVARHAVNTGACE